MKVSIPADVAGLRIRHFKALSSIPNQGFNDEREGLLFLSDFLGITYSQVLQFDTATVRTMFVKAIQLCSEIVTEPLPPTLRLSDGSRLGARTFKLVDPDKIGIGWHIDFSACDISKDPTRLACLFYIPEGYTYSDVDANGNTLNPISARYNLFASEFPLQLFVSAASFFLRQYLKSVERQLRSQIATKKGVHKIEVIRRSLSRLVGRSQ